MQELFSVWWEGILTHRTVSAKMNRKVAQVDLTDKFLDTRNRPHGHWRVNARSQIYLPDFNSE